MFHRPERILRKAVVSDRVGFSETTLWRRVGDGTFPKPVRISKGAVGWLESEINQWIAERERA